MLRARLRRVWARLQAREDSEHEQALIRIARGVRDVLLPAGRSRICRRTTTRSSFGSRSIFLADLVAAIAILLAHHPAAGDQPAPAAVRDLRRQPRPHQHHAGRRTLGLRALSHAALDHPRPRLPLRSALSLGLRPCLSLVMFGAVVAVSPAWREIPALAGALVASLVILPIYFAILLRKLTNAIARAEEASRAKSHFLAAMSHELRTPLNAIIGMSELLGTTRLDGEQRDMTATVRTAATSLLGLVDQVLDLAKIEERRLHDRDRAVRPARQPDRGCGCCWATSPPPRALALRLRLAPDTPWRLRGGPRQLHQALVNLVGNAIKFTDRGRVVIRGRADPPRGRTPSGCASRSRTPASGFRPRRRPRCSSASPAATTACAAASAAAGSGSTSPASWSQLMGGTVGMSSVLGQGSTFWIELPFELEPAPAAPERLAGRVVVVGGRDAAAAPRRAGAALRLRGPVRRHRRIRGRAAAACRRPAGRARDRSRRHRSMSRPSPACWPDLAGRARRPDRGRAGAVCDGAARRWPTCRLTSTTPSCSVACGPHCARSARQRR